MNQEDQNNQPQEQPPPVQAGGAAPPQTPDPARAELEALYKEKDELFARLQRISADYQNYQKRAEQNRVDSVHLAKGDLLRLLIPVLDHFETAMSQEPQSEDGKNLYKGVKIVRDELLKLMQQSGVERIEVKVGDAFDPHLHEAMLHQVAEGVAPHHISMVLQPGYVYRQRTLRPAKVAVAPE